MPFGGAKLARPNIANNATFPNTMMIPGDISRILGHCPEIDGLGLAMKALRCSLAERAPTAEERLWRSFLEKAAEPVFSANSDNEKMSQVGPKEPNRSGKQQNWWGDEVTKSTDEKAWSRIRREKMNQLSETPASPVHRYENEDGLTCWFQDEHGAGSLSQPGKG